jgi:hypothetical protein
LPQSPDLFLTIEIEFAKSSQAKAALKALIPDNVNFPKGLWMKMSTRNSTLGIQVRAAGVAVRTVLCSVDEVLEHISLAKKVMAD